jgi:hypothetical protein
MSIDNHFILLAHEKPINISKGRGTFLLIYANNTQSKGVDFGGGLIFVGGSIHKKFTKRTEYRQEK